MLREIRCEKFRTRVVSFHPGLNAVLGDDNRSLPITATGPKSEIQSSASISSEVSEFLGMPRDCLSTDCITEWRNRTSTQSVHATLKSKQI